MILDNPLFSKDSLKQATSRLSWDSHTLLYEGSDDGSNREQEKAGMELRQCLWIIAAIIDHIFDYYPFSYYVAKEEQEEALDYYQWFKSHPDIAIRNAIQYAKTDFSVLETVTRDRLVLHRNIDEENHVISVLKSLEDDLPEIVSLLNGPKKVSDPSKPTEDEIKMLVNSVNRISCSAWKNAKMMGKSADEAFRDAKMYEMFLNPLLFAWQVYHYGSHSDFWEEGESMFGFMMFEVRAEEIINQLIEVLETQSPFTPFEQNGAITNGLLKVYRHLLMQDWKSKI